MFVAYNVWCGLYMEKYIFPLNLVGVAYIVQEIW